MQRTSTSLSKDYKRQFRNTDTQATWPSREALGYCAWNIFMKSNINLNLLSAYICITQVKEPVPITNSAKGASNYLRGSAMQMRSS